MKRAVSARVAKLMLCLLVVLLAGSSVSVAAMESTGNLPQILWQQPVDGIPQTPVVGEDGSVYVTVNKPWRDSPSVLYAFTKDGHVKWTYPLKVGFGSPVLGEGNVLYITDGSLYALNSADGSMLWKLNDSASSITGTPVIHREVIYATDSFSRSLVAVDLKGNVLWKDQVSADRGWLSPVTLDAEGNLYVVEGDYLADVPSSAPYAHEVTYGDGSKKHYKYESTLHVYDPDGFPLWSTLLDGLEPLQSAPILTQGGDIVVGSNMVYVVDQDGSIRWHTSGEENWGHGEVALMNDRIYYPYANELFVYDLNGKTLQTMHYGALFGKPLITDDGTIHIWNEAGWLRALHLNGTEKWTYVFSTDPIGVSATASVTLGTDHRFYTAHADINNHKGTVLVYVDKPTSINSGPVVPRDGIEVRLNGTELNFATEPMFVRGRVFVPMRDLFTQLGATLVYKDGVITAIKGETTLVYKLGESTALVNGQSIAVEAPGKVYDGRAMVPLRFVSAMFGYDVTWTPGLREVSIVTK